MAVERDTGFAAALRRLYDSDYLALVRLAAAVLRDQDWAEDVVQDAFLQVQRSWSRLRDPDSAVHYLRRTVLNGARAELRRRSVRSAKGPDLPPLTGDGEAEALGRIRHAELLDAVSALPRRQAQVVLLRFVGDLSVAETAAALSISPGAVKTTQTRAVEALRIRWGAQDEL